MMEFYADAVVIFGAVFAAGISFAIGVAAALAKEPPK